MSDDLDDLLRRTMKTLDDQVPSGYFEGLPKRTLARLGEDSSMQTTTGSTSDNSAPTGVPPQDRDEDSGLHDIRSMASSAKMRISSRRISQPPPMDEDILASSSAGWKAVALPEPARMVSLPELSSVDEVKSERKSKKELKAERTSASKIAKEAIAVETSAVASPAPAAKPALDAKPDVPVVESRPIIGARFAQQQKKSKGGIYAMVGVGLAAAAGVGWYVSTQMDMSKSAGSENQLAMDTTAQQAPAAPTVSAIPLEGAAGSAAAPEPPAEPKADTVVATGMAAEEAKPADSAEAPGADRAGAAKPKAAKDAKGKKQQEDPTFVEVKTTTKVEPKKEDKKGSADGDEPSFDALLKEANIQDKKPAKVALDKKSLSGADIKKGMSSVAGKAQACFAGTQGTAQVKLTVAPSGQVQKVSVTGVFAGTPVGACVQTAVKGATFPEWDGGPQSFGYSYLLAE